MSTTNASATTRPQPVRIESLPDGQTRVILSRGTTKVETEEGAVFSYEEAVFMLPDERSDNAAAIEENFDDWWGYAEEDHTPPTIEERVALLEDVILGDL